MRIVSILLRGVVSSAIASALLVLNSLSVRTQHEVDCLSGVPSDSRCQAFEFDVPLVQPEVGEGLGETKPTEPTIWIDYDDFIQAGQRRYSQGDAAAAIEYYDRAIAADRGQSEVYALRATAYLAAGNAERAIEDYTRAISLGSEDVSVIAANHIGRAIGHNRLGQFHHTLADTTRALGLDPDFAAAYTLRGAARNQLADVHGACHDWKRAAELYRTDGRTERYNSLLALLGTASCP